MKKHKLYLYSQIMFVTIAYVFIFVAIVIVFSMTAFSIGVNDSISIYTQEIKRQIVYNY
ncbi:MAG: hypothetical protein LBM99_05090 [Bacillales bacterium]|jgi:uncharacterized membrane protein YqiK|nr:hypothetical protein [Bacillales bacterium]